MISVKVLDHKKRQLVPKMGFWTPMSLSYLWIGTDRPFPEDFIIFGKGNISEDKKYLHWTNYEQSCDS